MKHIQDLIKPLAIGAIVLGLTACGGQAPEAAAPTATPKPPAVAAGQPVATPAPVVKATAAVQPATEPTAAPAATAQPEAAPASPEFAALNTLIAVQSAQTYAERAGFHEIAEQLEQTSTIQPEYLSTVRNALTVINATPWPTDLSSEQQKFVADLKALEAALIANRPADALKAADAVHESEHDLTQATFAWLGEQKSAQMDIFKTPGDVDYLLGSIGVQSAQMYIAGASFHELAEQLEQTSTIQPEYLSTVRNALTVINAIPWPTDLSSEQQKFVVDLQALEAALVANTPADATKAADAVHESEHDLTQATFAWLGEQKHDMGVMMAAMDGDKTMQHVIMTGVQSAQMYIAGASFHELAEQLEQTSTIQPEYLSTVRNALTVINATPWPNDLSSEQQKFVADLQALEAALIANRPADALKAADAVHESEHDLTQATFAWLEGSKVR
jgi:hypothetical protein